jgi:tRNA/tmRNA/rRNA uracil-C5-methylase (TrmA/RlmC/RlmD family)
MLARAMATAPLAPCPHRPPCPGCPRYGEPGVAPAALARLRSLAREARLPEPAVRGAAPRLGFRHRARLMVRGRSTSPKVGLFQQCSHRIADIPECRIHHPLVNEVAAALRRAVRESGVEPYADRPHRGDLRAAQIVVERAGPRAQVVLVGNAADPAPLEGVAERLSAALGARLQGLWWNGNPDRTNVILGPHWRHLAGEEAVRERIGGADVFFPPGAFGQSELELADALVARIHAGAPAGAVVAELYAGCGAIGLGLVARSREVRFNEASPHALAGLALGIAALPPAGRARARVAPGAAGDRLALLEGADLVIVDPPRRGLDPPLAAALATRPPRQLVYVSCDLASFERDAAGLCAGGLRLAELEAWNLFPFTGHVETLARFEAVHVRA